MVRGIIPSRGFAAVVFGKPNLSEGGGLYRHLSFGAEGEGVSRVRRMKVSLTDLTAAEVRCHTGAALKGDLHTVRFGS